MMNTEFDSEFFFDINQYLIDTYPQMSLPDRRAICAEALNELDEDDLIEQLEEVVAQYALKKCNFTNDQTDTQDE